MYISDFKLLDVLREKMGDQEALSIIEYINNRLEENYIPVKKEVYTNENLLRLEIKILETIHKYELEKLKIQLNQSLYR